MWKILLVGSLGGVLLGVTWQPVWVALAGGAGIGATALVTWLLGRRRESGSVRTSQAGELWTAYDSLLERVTQDNAVVRADLARANDRIAALESKVGQLQQRLRNAGINDE